MKAGSSQVRITPPVGIDLGGYVDRRQPSIGVHDDLYVRALYLEYQDERLLWLHCDLISLTTDFVKDIKKYFKEKYALLYRQVIISATHTHSGPATIPLRQCGVVDDVYMEVLKQWLIKSAGEAIARTELVSLSYSETQCDLATDRRSGSRYQHANNTLPVLAFRRAKGGFMALIANYAMHNVALSYQNRLISSDVAGIAAEHARLSLAGSPVVLLTNGACANTVPPEVSPDPRIMIGFGKMIGEKIVGSAQNSKSFSSPVLCTLIEDIELPLTRLSNDDILLEHDRETTRYAGKPNWLSAIKAWKDDTLSLLAKAPPNCINAVLHVIRIGPFTFTAISAEVFSRLADELRSVGGAGNYVVGYANGNVGYLPFREIYDEGGYEVMTAYKFYSNFMVSVGGYERVRDWAIILLGALHEGNIALEDPSGQLSA